MGWKTHFLLLFFRYKLLHRSKERQSLDGLNNLNYSPLVSRKSLYTNVSVTLSRDLAPVADYWHHTRETHATCYTIIFISYFLGRGGDFTNLKCSVHFFFHFFHFYISFFFLIIPQFVCFFVTHPLSVYHVNGSILESRTPSAGLLSSDQLDPTCGVSSNQTSPGGGGGVACLQHEWEKLLTLNKLMTIMLNDFRIAIVGVEGYALFSARNKHSWFCVLG